MVKLCDFGYSKSMSRSLVGAPLAPSCWPRARGRPAAGLSRCSLLPLTPAAHRLGLPGLPWAPAAGQGPGVSALQQVRSQEAVLQAAASRRQPGRAW
jgi:hypothetical protein